MPMVTLFFKLTHVTYLKLHHTVVIRYRTSVTYRTLYYAGGHLVISCECYQFERVLFTLRRVLPCTPSCFFRVSLGPEVQPQSYQGFMMIFETQPSPGYLFESQQSTKYLYVVGSIQGLRLACHGTLSFTDISFTEHLFYGNFIFEIFTSYGI